MTTDYAKYGPRLAELARELLRTKDVDAWIGAYCALCAEVVPGEVDNIGEVSERFAGAALKLLTPAERVHFAALLMSTSDLVGRLRTKIREIKAQKGTVVS